MTRVVFITQHVDAAHPALAATLPKLEALARTVDEVVVLALTAQPRALPPNCRIHVFGKGNKLVRTARFAVALERALRGQRPFVVVAHMVPLYAILAAPQVRLRRIPLLLWYTHWRATIALRVAERLVSGIASVDRRSFPLPSRKVSAIGHGIDLAEFRCREALATRQELRVLSLGRYSPAKGYETVIRAIGLAAAAGSPARLRLVGPTLTDEERLHKQALAQLCTQLDLDHLVSLEDAVPRERVPALLADADVLVNNMRAGAPDKVVYEAAASCVPVVASNPVFDELLPEALRFRRDSPEELADRLRTLRSLAPDEVGQLGRELRDRVASGHTSDSWAAGLLAAATRL